MSQTQKISRNNTTIRSYPDGSIAITLYSTEILRHWPADRKIRVDTGGWFTATTRTRLTQAFNEWELPFWADFTKKTGNRLTNRATGEHVPFTQSDIAYASY